MAGNGFWDAYSGATNAFAVGQETAQRQQAQAQAQQDRQTAQQAGNAFAAGDWQGGAGTLFRGGDLANGQAALTFQQNNEDRALKITAEQVAAKKAALADQVSVSMSGLTALRDAKPGTEGALFDQSIAPTLAQRGLPQAAIDHIRSIAGNKDALNAELTALGQKATEYGFQNANGTVLRTDPTRGTATPIYQGYRKPDYVTPPAGTTATLVDPGTPGGPIGPDGIAPQQPQAPAPQASAPQGPSVTPAAPRTPRFTQIGQYAAQAGATPQDTAYLQRTALIESGGNPNATNGTSQGVFQFHPDTFYGVLPHGDINSPADQTKAALLLAQRDRQALQQHGVTPDDANTYIMHQQGSGGGTALLTAPPEVGAVAALEPVYGNSHTALAAIAGNIGMPYKTPAQRQAANAVAQQLTSGQFVQFWRQRWANGPQGAASATSGQPTAQTPAGAAPGGFQPPRTIQGPAKPTGHASTPQEIAAAGLPAGTAAWTDAGGKPTPYAADMQPGGGSGIPPQLAGLTGQELLGKLPQAQATTVKALSEGRLQFPTGMALSKPYWQQMLGLVGQYDPTFDQANPRSRAATRVDFTSGKSAQNITALNTVIGHLDDLDRAVDGLGNFSLPLNNWAARGIAEATGTDARFRQFDTAKTAVANELTRVFRGTGGAEADIKAWQSQLDSASSPTALRAVVHQMASLINSRLEALGEQYHQGMGVSVDPIRLLTPDKQTMFDRMRQGLAPGAQSRAAPVAGAPAVRYHYDSQGNLIRQ